ncbi:MAG: segregation/condensation protein A [Candidatus Aenigmarchaeota archaeon]|nr:segregation/condensation protein A [Candidatus Aenigmarchaeota archaeon]
MRGVNEENILKSIIEKESWEEILYYIVSVENLDPWDINLVKLTDSFIKFINKVKELDFRIPAKVVFVAAVLLRIKSEYLSIFEEKEKELMKETRPFEELGIDPNLVKLSYPVKRIPKRPITLKELVNALRKAIEVKERRERRRKFVSRRISEAVEFVEEDITQRLEEVFRKVIERMERDKKIWVRFDEIVENWERGSIVRNFVPLLHLEQEGKLSTFQEDFFKEIYISRSKT